MKKFLESDATDFIFLDSDISWEPWSLSQLLKHDADIVAGGYPFKNNCGTFPIFLKYGHDGRPMIDPETGLLDVHYAPTGFMRIKRSVFERFMDYYSDHLVEEWRDNKKEDEFFMFFDTNHDRVHKRFLGEDVNFCYKWAAMGGKIFVEPDIDLIHWGHFGWAGNFRQWLDANSPKVTPQQVIATFPSDEHPYPGNDIYGWMSLKELRWLYDRAGEMDSILEIGTFNGRSTHAIASGGHGTIHCVDKWESMHEVYGFEEDTFERADQRCADFLDRMSLMTGVPSRLSVYRESSIAASNRFESGMLDMVFIDGDHTTESVIQDVLAWLPKTKKLICGHDYSDAWHEVKRAVNGIFGDKVKVCDTIWYVKLGDT